MTIHLSIVIFLPLVVTLIGCLAGPRIARWFGVGGAAAVLAYTIVMLADFEAGGGLQYITDDNWISELGVRWSLGVDGLNLFLIALTALLWLVAALAATLEGPFKVTERPRLFYFNLALAETSVLGAFCAQDLALFVVFFDLMLVPFYFLIGAWGSGDRVRATTRFVIYTLVGSLLMLAGAIALGVLSTPEGGEISFSLAKLEQRSLGEGTQQWIFLLFAAAFVVKAPLFPFHGWVPATYRATSIPVLVVLSAVLSKVGVYGFLRIVLPILPDASVHFQDLMLVLAVVSILYGGVLAFSQLEARLVLAYSSIAQMGFIVLGIFALDGKGSEGAVVQMVAHGLVTAPAFLIAGFLAVRAGGSDLLERMGGAAFRAPVLAGLFLIVALATLAMPGSPNFVGEILILYGTFEDKLVYGLVASVGVVFASIYGIRLFQRTMHNRVREGLESRDVGVRELATLVPLVAVIVAFGVYPQFVLERTEETTGKQIEAAAKIARGEDQSAVAPAPGAVPEGGAPPGAVPQGAPPGAVPEGAVPQGAPPPTGAPPGAPPDGVAPEGAAPPPGAGQAPPGVQIQPGGGP